ncbi:peptidylprolyl isomerase [Candidatus Pelagibacter sp.]|uniref:peptidylprolyl isomerase n=1 Tax=uncultured Candidatus Pelagibacter sp. TaxID=372654 RepID=UPI00233BC557|nr:peptidylprolyl isomerase [uncultured Candidatus Pelagibacter sp.]MDC0405035.1 peptidylprolyl isomerase [Candidatus Pelagibacter sp.]
MKIENQIITSLDVNSEYKYLIALNPSLKNSNKKDVIELSKRSIVNERIKKIEIEKTFKNPQLPEEFLNKILQNVYSRIGLANLDDFKEYLILNNVDIENVKNKLEIEALWNELILIKFSSKVKINEKNLKAKINKDNKFSKSYLLSEISFEVSNLNDLDNKFSEISDVINNSGFDFAALKYSVSTTSNFGGKLDWINENSLNRKIKDAIKNLKINDFTKPINVSGGFLILQINDIRNTQIEVNVEEELIKITNFEKNNQLNQYSKIYFNKIKKNLQIDEL